MEFWVEVEVSDFLLAQHNFCRIIHVGFTIGLRNKRYRSRCSWVGLDDVNYFVPNTKLTGYQSYRVQSKGDFACMISNLPQHELADSKRRQGRVRVPRVDCTRSSRPHN